MGRRSRRSRATRTIVKGQRLAVGPVRVLARTREEHGPLRGLRVGRGGSSSTRPTSSGASTSCRAATILTSTRARRRTSSREASRRRPGSTRPTAPCEIPSDASSISCRLERAGERATRRRGAAPGSDKAPHRVSWRRCSRSRRRSRRPGAAASTRPAAPRSSEQRARAGGSLPRRGGAPARAAGAAPGTAPRARSAPGVLAACCEGPVHARLSPDGDRGSGPGAGRGTGAHVTHHRH